MTRDDILITAGVGLLSFAAGFLAGKWYTWRQIESSDLEFGIYDDGVNGERKYTETFDKPDIFEIGEKVHNDYTKYVNNLSEKLNDVAEDISEVVEDVAEDISETVEEIGEVVKKNIFDETEPYLSVVDEDEAKDLVANGYDTLTATYFIQDDIVAGFDNDLEKLDEVEYELTLGVQALANVGEGSVFLKNDSENVVYELVLSEEHYEDAIKEVE